MIKYIRFNNFYSYLDETEVSFELNKQATTSAYDFTVETAQNKIRLNKIMAILGANGSGKTQLLKALDFVVWFISFSALTKENRDNGFTFSPHFLSESKDSNFELRFLLANHDGLLQEYKYELKIVNQTIIEENLFVKSSSQFSYIFKRIYNQGELNYKHKDFLKPSLADDIPNNVSLISYAFLFDIKLAQVIIDLFGRTQSNVSPNGKLNKISQSLIETTELFNRNEMLKSHAENLLCKFDTGIQVIRLKEVTVLTEDKSESKQILLPFGVHKTSDGKEFELVFFQESNGTQSAYNLLGLILPVLQNGGVAIIDELDNDLHPHLLPEIFNLFRSEHTNPHNAQLIFTCHTPEVFNILNKHQIYLVEKFDQQSEAWRLDEVEGVRNDDNLYAKYMAGAFSAVPNL